MAESNTKRGRAELEELRKQSRIVDSASSKYRAIVSVLMLKEGWDVRNVTTIVGLRPYSAKANILPEQALGRGLRKMYTNTDEIKQWLERNEGAAVIGHGLGGALSQLVTAEFPNLVKETVTFNKSALLYETGIAPILFGNTFTN